MKGWSRHPFVRNGLAALAAAAVVAAAPAGPAQAADFDDCLGFDRRACDRAVAADPGNLTALFMRGLAAELAGDDLAALADFDATVAAEPRHFGAQLWRHVAALSLGRSRETELRAYLDSAKQLGDWPRALAELYLGESTAEATLAAATSVPASAEAACAAEYHVGRTALLAGRIADARAAFTAALGTGAAHVFEYQAAALALKALP
jgi:lipoprotein NlpI